MLGREALLCIGFIIASPAFAAPPAGIVPTPELEAWFKALRATSDESPMLHNQ